MWYFGRQPVALDRFVERGLSNISDRSIFAKSLNDFNKSVRCSVLLDTFYVYLPSLFQQISNSKSEYLLKIPLNRLLVNSRRYSSVWMYKVQIKGIVQEILDAMHSRF